MKKFLSTLVALAMPVLMLAQGWPANYGGVMLQAFYWDSYTDTRWTNLTSQADELSSYFDLLWIPQSGNCGGSTSMGYDPLYLFNSYTSSFGNETTLREMISTFKAKGTGIIADVVINHHKSTTNWVTFPAETYNGTTYQLVSTDVTKNDDGGDTKTWADTNGYELSSNNDTGEDWSGMRDLDHNSDNVQKYCLAYLDKLINDLGYTGVRYDMVKGYSSSFTGLYNSTMGMEYSVGEYWDGYVPNVQTWINGTKVNDVVQSAAFDFPFRYTARDVVNESSWAKLGNASLARQTNYKRYSITFIENHDTEKRSSDDQDPIKADTIALNAFMLSMPGTPCIFLKHWQDYKQELKQLIDVRKAVGIHNQSTATTLASNTAYFISRTSSTTSGKNLVVIVGTAPEAVITQRTNGYTEVASGYHYGLYMDNTMETAWVDKASGTYENSVDVKLIAVTATDKQLVYSTDGGNTWTNATSGDQLTFTTTTSLQVGLSDGSSVTGIITREYEIEEVGEFVPYDITVYVKDPTVDPYNWTSVYYWAWDDNGTSLNTTKTWPGDPMTQTTTVKGDTFYYQSFTISERNNTVNFIYSQKGSPQTVDITGITQDIYLELGELVNSKYDYVDITEQYSGGDDTLTGDVNGDGDVDITDVNEAINMVLGITTVSSAADVDGNGTVDITDVNAIINIVLGK